MTTTKEFVIGVKLKNNNSKKTKKKIKNYFWLKIFLMVLIIIQICPFVNLLPVYIHLLFYNKIFRV